MTTQNNTDDEPDIHAYNVSVDPDGIHVTVFFAWCKLFGLHRLQWLWDWFGDDIEDDEY